MAKRTLFRALIGGLALIALAGCTQTNLPRAEFTATPPYDYPPLDVTFDAGGSSSPNGAIVSYEWDFGDGEKGSGVVVAHSYPDKGVYVVTLTVTDSAGKIGERAKSVQALNRLPTAAFEIDKYWVGEDQPIEFDASASQDPDGEIVEYRWSFGDGSVGYGMVVEHEYALLNGGSWKPTVVLTVVDEDGGESSVTHKVNVVGCGSCG